MGGRGGAGGVTLSNRFKADAAKYIPGMENTQILSKTPEGWRVEAQGVGYQRVSNKKSFFGKERQSAIVVTDKAVFSEFLNRNKAAAKYARQVSAMSDRQLLTYAGTSYNRLKNLKTGSNEMLSEAGKKLAVEREIRRRKLKR